MAPLLETRDLNALDSILRRALLLLLAGLFSARAAQEGDVAAALEEVVTLPTPIDDPLEPVNRGLWVFNRGLLLGVVRPTGIAYRAAVGRPVREGIRNVGRNLGYPRRLINNAARGQWIATRDETFRFLANSTIGLGGFFDVATRKFKIREWEADFGETFGLWGWEPQVYLMLPVYGPSNDRDALGLALDSLANPLVYFPPYSYANPGIVYNNLAETAEPYARAIKSEFDPYYILRYAWTLKRDVGNVDFTLSGEQDPASLETLRTVFFTPQDPEFSARGKTRSVLIPATNTKLPFTYWLQKTNSPIVYLAPGLGAHRWSEGTVALAEMLFNAGFSVAAISSAYNYEFIESALTAPMPGYTPRDARDTQVALTQVDKYLQRKFPKRIGRRALMGYSMGGFFALHLAATNDPSLVQFDRYVAINAPMRLLYGVGKLDRFYDAALDWPAGDRANRIEQTLRKVVVLSAQAESLTPDATIPMSATESKFLVGLAFRLKLRDLIWLSERRENQGIIKAPLSDWNREAAYREILRYSFAEYLQKFVVAYYAANGVALEAGQALERSSNLQAHEASLKENTSVRLVENANDILLEPTDLDWMRKTFGERLRLFERGGHLGNLDDEQVQQAIIETVSDLR